MFGSVSSGGGYSSPAPPVEDAPAETRRRGGAVLGHGLYAPPERLLIRALEPRRVGVRRGGRPHDASCRVADACASGVNVEGTNRRLSSLRGFPDNFFDGPISDRLLFEWRAGRAAESSPRCCSTTAVPRTKRRGWRLAPALNLRGPDQRRCGGGHCNCPHCPAPVRPPLTRKRRVTTPRRQRSRRSPINGRRCPYVLDAQVPCGADAGF